MSRTPRKATTVVFPADIPGAQPPVELQGLEQRKRHKVAAGFKALSESMRFGATQAGVANSLKTFPKLNQVHGFDCQSCAWPNPDKERSLAEFCENGFKAVSYEADTKRLTADFFREHSLADLAARSDHWLGHQGRLTEPLVKRPDATHYEPIGWDEAFKLLARELKALDSPDEAVFYTSGRTSNETAFLYQLFVRTFGTNNLPDCSNMCHESTSVALPPMIGIGKACVKLEDFDHAQAIFILGQNPGTNHPRMLTALQRNKERGGKIVFVNPLPETGGLRFKNPQDLLHPTRMPRFLFGRGTDLADLWLPVRIAGDQAFLHGLMKELFAAEEKKPGRVLDHAFLEHHTQGLEKLRAQIEETSWKEILEFSGLTRDQIRAAAEIAIESRRTIVCWCMGLTQHRNAVATIQDIVNFLLLQGHLGRPGSGPCPVRGHSNVQGDRTMGIWDKPKPEFLDALEREFGIKAPRAPGLDTVEAIEAMHAGKAKVLFAMGGNFLSAPSDTEFTAAALQRCRLTAHVAIKLNRAHVITGRTALLLPCLGRSEIDRTGGTEQFQTVEDTMGVINATRGVIEPASPQLRSETAIVAGIAKATLGPEKPIDWDAYAANYDLIRDKIESVVPGFPAYNQRIRVGTFYLPNPPRDERRFDTKTGKAMFQAHALEGIRVPEGHLLLTTLRSHDQFNTSIYGHDDRYRGIFNGRRVIFLNEEDIADLGLVQGQLVDITSHFKKEQRHARAFMVAPYPIPKGNAAGYFPELNVLVPLRATADKSNTPLSKEIIITVSPSVETTPVLERV